MVIWGHDWYNTLKRNPDDTNRIRTPTRPRILPTTHRDAGISPIQQRTRQPRPMEMRNHRRHEKRGAGNPVRARRRPHAHRRSDCPYNPRTWDEGSFYQCPKPWSKEPAKYWIALDNLRPLEGFNPDLYELAAGKDKGKPLSLVFERKVPMLTMADADGKRKSATTSRRSGLTRIRLREV